jgi:hypothetical protein
MFEPWGERHDHLYLARAGGKRNLSLKWLWRRGRHAEKACGEVETDETKINNWPKALEKSSHCVCGVLLQLF